MPPLHILMKPASGHCNLHCSYCFYHDIMENREQATYGFMSEETVENIVRKALKYAEGECTFAFQGGEPTLAGLDFFRKVVELVKKYNTKPLRVNYAIQTNGYGLDAEWAQFFRDNRFLVGISVDGTKEDNDRFRFTPQGKSSFNRVWQTVQLFQKFYVQFNILTVVHRHNYRHIERMYRFFQRNNLHYLQFIPCLEPFGAEAKEEEYSLTAKQYGEFLKTLFDLWYRDLQNGNPVYIREFENYIGLLLGQPAESCGMRGVCSCQHVVEADGTVYPCDFYMLDQYKLGNLNDCDFSELMSACQSSGFLDPVPVDEACKTCQWGPLCRGGCKRYREPFENDEWKRNCFCEAYQMFFEHAIDRMVDVAQRVKRQAAMQNR